MFIKLYYWRIFKYRTFVTSIIKNELINLFKLPIKFPINIGHNDFLTHKGSPYLHININDYDLLFCNIYFKFMSKLLSIFLEQKL